jgi:hypothetical protein
MEGINSLMILALLAFYGLGGLFLLLLLVSIGLRLAGNKPVALKVFASSVLCLSLGSASFPLALAAERSEWWQLMVAFSVGLALAGIGQFITAIRHPPSYRLALMCSMASAAFVAQPLITYGYHNWLRGLLIGGPSVLLGMASIRIGLSRWEWPDTRKGTLLLLGLVNLTVVLLAIVNLHPYSGIIYISGPNEFNVKDQIMDLGTNTMWWWVIAATAGSILITSAIAIFRRSSAR